MLTGSSFAFALTIFHILFYYAEDFDGNEKSVDIACDLPDRYVYSPDGKVLRRYMQLPGTFFSGVYNSCMFIPDDFHRDCRKYPAEMPGKNMSRLLMLTVLGYNYKIGNCNRKYE